MCGLFAFILRQDYGKTQTSRRFAALVEMESRKNAGVKREKNAGGNSP